MILTNSEFENKEVWFRARPVALEMSSSFGPRCSVLNIRCWCSAFRSQCSALGIWWVSLIRISSLRVNLAFVPWSKTNSALGHRQFRTLAPKVGILLSTFDDPHVWCLNVDLHHLACRQCECMHISDSECWVGWMWNLELDGWHLEHFSTWRITILNSVEGLCSEYCMGERKSNDDIVEL